MVGGCERLRERRRRRVSYKNTCFSPFGGLKRSAIRGRRGSGEGLRRRAGLGRTRGMAATLAAVVFMMALAAFMVWLDFWDTRMWCRSRGVGEALRSSAKTFDSEVCEVIFGVL